MQTRTILDLTPEELRQMIETDTLPPDVSLQSMETHPQFLKLFRARNSPKKVAKILLEDQGIRVSIPGQPGRGVVEYKPSLPLEYRLKQLELKEKELKIKADKVVRYTDLYKKILSVESDVKKMLKILLKIV